MRQDAFWPSWLIYVLSTVGLLLLLFLFLQSQGMSWGHLGIALALFVPVIGVVGYLLLSGAHEEKERQDVRLEHMTREILHEINLPIATIKSNLQMLAMRIENPHNRKRVARAEEALTRLQRLYDELSYAIRKEIHAIEKETFDLADVLQERAVVHAELRRNPIHVMATEGLMIHADRIGLEQMLDNLIGNGMKYSEADESIDLILEGSVLKIQDHGVGMDAAQIARIYERYYQSDSHTPGEGIGLALVKRYCDESGIDIRIDSVPGAGTTVTLDCAKIVPVIQK